MNSSQPILLVTVEEGRIVQVWMHPYVYSQVTVVVAPLDRSTPPQIHHPVSLKRLSPEVKEALMRMIEEEEQSPSPETKKEVLV